MKCNVKLWKLNGRFPALLTSLCKGNEGQLEQSDRDSFCIIEFLMALTHLPMVYCISGMSGSSKGMPGEFSNTEPTERFQVLWAGTGSQLLSLSSQTKFSVPRSPGNCQWCHAPDTAEVDSLQFWIYKFCSPFSTLNRGIINVRLQTVICGPCQRYVIWLCM